MRLLIIEDDTEIAEFLMKGLRAAGFAVDHVVDGEEGRSMAEQIDYDALIVDIMLPKLDGLTLIETIRKKGIQSPVLILSARHSVDDKIKGLQIGGDDYITKPFAFSELLARVQALIRRSSGGGTTTELRVGDLSLNLLSREVKRGDKSFELRPREFALLEYLMRNVGNVVSKTMILEHVWDYHFDPQTNVVDVLVHRLRSKIDHDFKEKMIHTVRGVGYALKLS